jgi:hypothetical protein
MGGGFRLYGEPGLASRQTQLCLSTNGRTELSAQLQTIRRITENGGAQIEQALQHSIERTPCSIVSRLIVFLLRRETLVRETWKIQTSLTTVGVPSISDTTGHSLGSICSVPNDISLGMGRDLLTNWVWPIGPIPMPKRLILAALLEILLF